MSALSAPALAPAFAGDLGPLLDRLTDDQKRSVVRHLLPPFLASVREPRSVTDPDGRVVGYFLPAAALDAADLVPDVTPPEAGPPGPLPNGYGVSHHRNRRPRDKDLFAHDLGGGD